MKVSVNISLGHTEPCAVIYTNQMTDEIYMIRVENGCKEYVSRKYLPELKKYLGL